MKTVILKKGFESEKSLVFSAKNLTELGCKVSKFSQRLFIRNLHNSDDVKNVSDFR